MTSNEKERREKLKQHSKIIKRDMMIGKLQ